MRPATELNERFKTSFLSTAPPSKITSIMRDFSLFFINSRIFKQEIITYVPRLKPTNITH